MPFYNSQACQQALRTDFDAGLLRRKNNLFISLRGAEAGFI